MAYKRAPGEPIAIVGSGCRFPGKSTSPSKLWELLREPYDLSKEVPENRFKIAGFYHPDGEHHGTTNAPQSYWIEQDHRLFDASFFNITPKEAEAIDPQQKMLLEVVYEAIESAGIAIQEYSGKKVSCYVGSMTADFDGLTQKDEQTSSQYCATGTSRAIISNRISYFFNWKGPSMTIDTACSSSLVAMHQAILGLRGGEAEMACIGGANVMLSPENFIAEASLHMLSPTGKSRMWDANADGYARGEGVAAVILKTLSKALADGDVIEGIVRETGVNSNGRNKGITMPSAELQAALIEDTYRKSGLDPRNPLDRPQFFEAHGTGTQAGDPREANAINNSFFGDPESEEEDPNDTQAILVGSIKTVIGHTEGAAGVAGIIKAVLAMRHGQVPPNQHLEILNPSVAPFCKHFKVPVVLTEWPPPPPGQPFRASVNSFGFGGTNAHAILERYEPSIHDTCVGWQRKAAAPSPQTHTVVLPLIISASSEKTLIKAVEQYSNYLKDKSLNLSDLAWTLAHRRSHLPQKIAFTGLSQDDVVAKMDKELKHVLEKPDAGFGARSKISPQSARILGIFTGQGAQWSTMSRELLISSQSFKMSIQDLQRVLDRCSDPPAWSIEKELSAPAETSRLGEAALSQPLCTALQVALVDLLKVSGISFYGVVGHSSGEIGAAYAAGRLSAKDAILIAYYRGIHAKLAGGANGQKGSMMAAGLDVEEAIDFCNQDHLRGRVCVAASNAPASVTLSGDKEAIEEAKADLDSRGKFARLLQVDTAYHSHHMERCGKPYLDSLKNCHVRAEQADESCLWVSSVYGPAGLPSTDELTGRYWRENMVQAVMFNEALERIIRERGPFDAAIEVGSHPALKGPATQTMKSVLGSGLPYSGTLDRSKHDVLALGDCLAFLWTLPIAASVDFKGYARTFGDHGSESPQVLKDLPCYPWDHSQSYYREPRLVKQYLNKTALPHELLGVRMPEDSSQELRWRNILKPSTISWLKDHKFQGQIIVPAAAYCIMALDAARILAGNQEVQLVELQDLEIFQAISTDEDSPGVETIFSLVPTSEMQPSAQTIEASFQLGSTAVDGNLPLRKAVGGRVSVFLGNITSDSLPSRSQERPEMTPVDLDGFYASMLDIGLGYTGPFRALTSLQRRLNASAGTLEKPHPGDTSALRVRPALLDVCFQAAFAAFAAPGDGALWTAFLPRRIHRLRFDLGLCDVRPGDTSILDIDAYVTKFCPTTSQSKANFSGDIEVFNQDGQMEMQIEGINVVSFAAQTEADDRELYLRTVWNLDPVSEIVAPANLTAAPVDHDLIDSCQRVARFYLSNVNCRKQESFWPTQNTSLHGLDIVSGFNKVQSLDTSQSIDRLIQTSPHQAFLNTIRVCGENLPSLVPGMLDYAIEEASKLSKMNHHLSSVIKQIAHRYPRMKILEIASDETTTSSALQSLGSAFTSYTIAGVDDAPPEQIAKAAAKDSQGKIIRAGFDIHQDPLDQGYIAQSYDLVIASYVLRRAGSLEDVLKSLHGLIRPGGYFIALDSTLESFRHKFLRCFSSLPPGPEHAPLDWHDALVGAGFLGYPQTYQQNADGLSLTVCQAMDDCTQKLRKPLEISHHDDFFGNVLIVGGKRPAVNAIAQQLLHSLGLWNGQVTVVASFEEIQPEAFDTLKAAIILADLDEHIVATMNSRKLNAIQRIFSPKRRVLWLVSGFWEDNPYHNASVGMGRCIKAETPNMDLQFLDLDVLEGAGKLVAAVFLRLAMANSTELENQLWTTEHEIIVRDSKFMIPRIMPLESPNDRLNSVRRVVTKEVYMADSVVEILGPEVDDGTCHKARKLEYKELARALPPGYVEVQVDYSSLFAVKIGPACNLYICLGHMSGSTKRTIVLSQSNSSRIRVPIAHTHMLDAEKGNEAAFLTLIMSFLICQSIPTQDGPCTIILNDPNDSVALAFQISKLNDQRLLCLTSDPKQSDEDSSRFYVHPWTTNRKVKSLIPSDTTCFVDFSQKDGTLTSILKEALPASSRYIPRDMFFRTTPGPGDRIATRMKSLEEAILGAKDALRLHPQANGQATVVPVRHAVQNGSHPLFTVLNWTEDMFVPELQQQVKPSMVFSRSKTYLLVGLTGELGQSLCKLMVQNGVRYLVSVSRNPNRKPKWRDELQAMGAKVLIEPMDAAKMSDVTGLRDHLAKSMPPIAGVVNGAMVLADGLFADMGLDSFQKVIRPKITGSENLDRAFSSVDLDFFIMFSSLTAVAGNRGQSNYAAANMYMAGLAAQRRKRGVAGSVLDIGMLYGIGYINRTEGAEIYNNLRKQGYRPISEQDIHHMFVETVLAGRPDSGADSELITGLQRFSLTDKTPLHWHFNPKFSHHTNTVADAVGADAGSASESVRVQLRQASSADECGATLKNCFAVQLETMLQLPANSIEHDIPIIELGVDSLVAVEVRSWFLKETDKDMPVLKVLGGSTLAELCDEIAADIYADNRTAADTAAEPGCDYENLAESSAGTKTTTTDANTPLTAYSGDDLDDDELPELGDRFYQKTAKMSYGQARLWFPYVYLQDKTAYNTTTSYKLKGSLNVPRFDRAIQSVIKRHEVLRMSFFTDPSTGQSIQAVSPDSSFALKTVSPADEAKDVKREMDKIEQYHYDLENGDAFIATLLSHSQESHTVIFGYHHIILDAVSWQFFLQDLEKFYSSENPKVESVSRYTDFAIKQRRLMESGGAQEKRQYWRSEFVDLPPSLPVFPFSRVNTRKNQVRYDIQECFFLLDRSLVADVKRASTVAKTTSFHFYLATLQVLLYRFLGSNDLCIGITDANRIDPAFMHTIGFLLDSLPLRFKIDMEETFIDRLQNTRSKVYSALGNSGVPLDVILDDLNVATSPETPPLFQILVNYRMGALKQKSMGDVQLDYLAYIDAKHPFDIILSIDEDEGAGGLTLSMQDYLYDQAGGNLLLQTYVHLLKTLSANIHQKINESPLFDDQQKKSSLTLSTGPKPTNSWPATLSRRVDSMIESSSDNVAIKDGNASVTYGQMAERTDHIALELHANGADNGSHVAVCCEPCIDMICSLLAILRLGAVYIPLDVRQSDERLSAILEESNAKIIVGHGATIDQVQRIKRGPARVVNVSETNTSVGTAVPNLSDGPSPAFIMFTSGSTGRPKGIVLTNTNMLTHVSAATQRMNIKREVVLQQSAYGYDASLAQIFYALANGGALIISSNRREMSHIAALMAEEQVTLTLCAPSEYTALFKYGNESLSRCKSWRIAMCGGEAFPSHLKSRFSDLSLPSLEVFNAYGPTEIAVASNIGPVYYRETSHHDAKVPIGQAMQNYASYILNDENQLAPIGWVGEICVAGPAVASGYLKNAPLTESKFKAITIPQASSDIYKEFRMYRTGDKGRMLPDGSIEYHGRIDGDTQVKLRGIRIEPDDIASTMVKTSVKVIVNAAVIVRDEDEILVAYVVLDSQRTPGDPATYLQQFLLDLPLPVYMRPAVAIPLDELPMNASGKLDVKLLKTRPLPRINIASSDSPELTNAENKMREVWEGVLPQAGLTINKSSNFFSVGGNSLLLLALQAEIIEVFGQKISLPELFQTNTFETMARKVQVDSEEVIEKPAPTSALGIDWEAETRLPAAITSTVKSTQHRRKVRKGPMTIILTGATGFLGRCILRQLKANPNILHIHCIATRPTHSNISRMMSNESSKVSYHVGNLSQHRLGLAEEEARLIFCDADAIIHNGADVSFMQTYHTLRKPNVDATKEILTMMADYRVPFHYVSTAGIAHLSNQDSFDEVSASPYRPPGDGSDGYVASKWASERVLERANEANALPVWIHRPSSITGEGAPPMDMMQNVMKFSRTMRAVPILKGWEGFFDYIDVESVAKGIIRSVVSSRLRLRGGVEYVHASGERVVPVGEVKEYLEREMGGEIKQLDMYEWASAAREAGLDELVAAYLATVADGEETTKLPRLKTKWRHGKV